MKLIVVLSVFVAVALARPQSYDTYKEAVIKKYETESDGSGNYKFGYETSDGQTRQETGEIVNAGTDDEALVVRGSFSFVGPDGVLYTVTYVADQDGFRPEGEHLPTRKTGSLGIPSAALGSLVGGGLGR